jgi:hypothetical protein
MELKQKLATLIDAYADAKRSGNETLIQLATAQLQEFFTAHEVVPAAPPIAETPGSDQE